jgi:hypothetical protein
MNKRLYLVQKSARLTCTWVATGDARKPLSCVWVAAAAPSVAEVTVNPKEVRMHQCA